MNTVTTMKRKQIVATHAYRRWCRSNGWSGWQYQIPSTVEELKR
jgi:hypothetical protein